MVSQDINLVSQHYSIKLQYFEFVPYSAVTVTVLMLYCFSYHLPISRLLCQYYTINRPKISEKIACISRRNLLSVVFSYKFQKRYHAELLLRRVTVTQSYVTAKMLPFHIFWLFVVVK